MINSIENKKSKGVLLQVVKTVKQHNLIEEGDHIVIGLSGGPDSVCLFFALLALKEELGIGDLTAVHVNHGLRAEEAERDQRYAEEMCRNAGVYCHVEAFDCRGEAASQGITEEEAGRNMRYEIFDKVSEDIARRSDSVVKIAVAQNANDQAETVLFRLMRGTGVDGIAAIKHKRKSAKGFDIIRPVLDIERTDIEAFCRENGLEPQMDSTNLKPVYARNKIRLELLEYMRENFNENIVSALCRLANLAGKDKEYLWEQAEEAFDRSLSEESTEKETVFDMNALLGMHWSIRHRVVMRGFYRIGLVKDIGEAHLRSSDEIIEKGETGSSVDFPQGYLMQIAYGKVILRKVGNPVYEELSGNLAIKKTQVSAEEYERTCETYGRGRHLALDLEELKKVFGDAVAENIELRFRQGGDYIALSSENGTKKIQDYFVDSKVRKDLRGRVPLVCIGNQVLWIMGDLVCGMENGIKKSRFTPNFHINNTTEQVLIVEVTTVS